MADNLANDFLTSLGTAMTAQATRPQKTSSTVTETPYALNDMIQRRNNLEQSLKAREGWGYNLANSLSRIDAPTTNDVGAGLTNFARGFGGAFNGRKNAQINNLQELLKADQMLGKQSTETVGYAGGSTGTGLQGAAQAYTDIDPTLPDRIRKSQGFTYLAREADAAARNPESAGILGRAWSSIAKASVPEGVIADRQGLVQEVSNIVRSVQQDARMGGITGGMMNSDKEGQRSLAVMSNPGEYSNEELASAVDTYIKFKDRALARQGLPSLKQGYSAISKKAGQENAKENKTGGLTY